jgi:uncharacterized protein (DUF1697 family)
MASHVAFLRGINLGARRRVSGEGLRTCFEGLGFRDVNTFRASGNVVFESDRTPAAAIARRIETALEDSLGFAVQTFLRTATQVRAIARQQPFEPDAVKKSSGKLQVLLLASAPSSARAREVLALETDADRLAMRGTELYWLPPGRMADSALDLRAIENAIGPTTMRTKGTVDQIASKYFTAG